MKKQLEMAKKLNEEGQRQREGLQTELDALHVELSRSSNTDGLKEAEMKIEILEAQLEEAAGILPSGPHALFTAIDTESTLNEKQRETVSAIISRFLGAPQ